MDIKLVEATGKIAMNYFIRFPKELYRDDPYYVYEPERLQREFLSEKNPFFRHSSARFFIAITGGRIAGRIAAITNTVHNRTFNEQTGFFGFFDTIESYEVAELLLDKVVEIHRENGFDRITGPTNFTTNDSCGVLVSGFDNQPVVLMPYNKPYYNDFLVRYGFKKEIDLSSYIFGKKVLKTPYFGRSAKKIPDRLGAMGIRFRNISYKELENELAEMREVYNASNRNNWGFIPLNEDEFRYMAGQFKQFVPEELVLIAEKEGKQIGFLVTLPDLNQVFRRIPSGKLFPFGFVQYLWYRRKISKARIIILGIREEYRNLGIDFVMYEQLRQNLVRLGYREGEACYVMENNGMMHSIIQKAGCEKLNEYRIYSRNLPSVQVAHQRTWSV
jgi:GNAT superfamily N-acetyltransferase